MLRNRIDKFGVAEPLIQRQGDREIVIQLPGLKDPKRALDLIGKTAVLEFKLVDEKASVERALKGRSRKEASSSTSGRSTSGRANARRFPSSSRSPSS